MLTQLQKGVNYFLNMGIREDYSTVKANRIQITNAFFVIAFPLIFFNTISNIIEGDSVGFTIDIVLMVIIFVIPIFNKYGWHSFIYSYSIFLTTIITDGLFVLFGPMISISPLYMLGILMTVFCYDRFWVRALLVVFVFLNYFYMQEFYLPNHEAIIQKINEVDYADHLYFIFSVVAVTGITIRVLNQNKAVLKDNKAQLEETNLLNKQLENKNHELERFSYISSHDLKEPLRSITSFSHLLQKHLAPQNDETAQEYLKYIKDNATHMNELVNSIAHFMNISNEISDKELVDTNHLLHNTIKNLAFKIQEKSVEVTFINLPTVKAIPNQLSILFVNLFENAIKYNTSKPPIITVTAAENSRHFIFSIKDNGIGIAPEFINQIFSPFKKLHHKTTYEGSGVGLSICKKIVEQHNGEMWVESELGKGSTFFFSITKYDE